MRLTRASATSFLLLWTAMLIGVVVSAPPRSSARASFEHQEDNVLRFAPEDRIDDSLISEDPHHQQAVGRKLMTNFVDEAVGWASKFGGGLGGISTVSGRLHNVIDCDLCKIAVTAFQSMLTKNVSRDGIKSAFIDVCSVLKVESKRVCSGLGVMFSPEVFTVLDNLVVSPKEVCSILIESCGTPYDPYNGWNVTFTGVPQPPPVTPIPPKAGSPTMKVLHLTDIHIDHMYKNGSVADCGEPLCCRDGKGSATTGAWKFGDYRHCDTPVWTMQNLMAHLGDQKDSFDYVIWTGDIPGHNIWNQSRADQLNVIKYAVNEMSKHFPGKPIYPSLGNHESSPVNSFPPNYIKGNNSISWLYDALGDLWSNWLPEEAIKTVRAGAYYTVSPYPGFRIISLNMNYCNNQNWWMLLNTTDPNGELSWLIKTLQQAEDHKEKVHILGHIPPGIHDCLEGWSWNFYKVVSRYQNTIVSQFYGHTHSDSFTMFYDVETLTKPINVAYVGPSITPYPNQNMGYRFYTVDGHYDGSSYHVLDHETHYLNLTKAHLEDKITWEFEYSAKAAYDMPSLFPADWDRLIDNMKTNQTLMDKYNRFYLKSRHTGSCDSTCRQTLLCEARRGRSGDQTLCKDL